MCGTGGVGETSHGKRLKYALRRGGEKGGHLLGAIGLFRGLGAKGWGKQGRGNPSRRAKVPIHVIRILPATKVVRAWLFETSPREKFTGDHVSEFQRASTQQTASGDTHPGEDEMRRFFWRGKAGEGEGGVMRARSSHQELLCNGGSTRGRDNVTSASKGKGDDWERGKTGDAEDL